MTQINSELIIYQTDGTDMLEHITSTIRDGSEDRIADDIVNDLGALASYTGVVAVEKDDILAHLEPLGPVYDKTHDPDITSVTFTAASLGRFRDLMNAHYSEMRDYYQSCIDTGAIAVKHEIPESDMTRITFVNAHQGWNGTNYMPHAFTDLLASHAERDEPFTIHILSTHIVQVD